MPHCSGSRPPSRRIGCRVGSSASSWLQRHRWLPPLRSSPASSWYPSDLPQPSCSSPRPSPEPRWSRHSATAFAALSKTSWPRPCRLRRHRRCDGPTGWAWSLPIRPLLGDPGLGGGRPGEHRPPRRPTPYARTGPWRGVPAMLAERLAHRRGKILGGVRPTAEDHRATTFELFFDLVYVFAV